MLQTVAIRGYRSLREIVLPLARLTVITGANGTGKSSLYRALRLLADCGRGEVIGSLAREGGLDSVLWAGPEHLSGARRTGKVEGTARTGPVSLELGFASDDFGYLVDLGLPQMAGHNSLFALDPEIKREAVFVGRMMRNSSTLVRRNRDYAEASAESGRGFDEMTRSLPAYRSVLAEYAGAHPELGAVRHRLRSWRFYDGFRVDAAAPSRLPHVGTRTPVLSDDGADLAAAVQTIIEAGFDDLQPAVAEAFDGATVSVAVQNGLFDLQLQQRGMLRPLRAAELSDGTLRFLLCAAALLEPAATVADGAQRARDLIASGPCSAVGVIDTGGRNADAGRRRHPLAGHAAISGHRARDRCRRRQCRGDRVIQGTRRDTRQGLGHADYAAMGVG